MAEEILRSAGGTFKGLTGKDIDRDLDEVAEASVKFAKEQKFSFWE